HFTLMPSFTSPRKSILKSSSNTTKDGLKPPTLSRDERNRQLALQHAHLLQHRKDIEARNLVSTERLLDLPSFSTASSETSITDTKVVKDALKTFQPSDYDALVEERNIDQKCGYVLCTRKNRSRDLSQKYRIITGSKEADFKVVEPKELEKWCSDECGRMALYLRVQLSEEPAWTREWQAAEPIELYSERILANAKSDDSIELVWQASEKRAFSDTKQRRNDRMTELAIERGDRGKIESLSAKVAMDVKENAHADYKVPIPPRAENTIGGGSIEGYVPTGKHVEKQPPALDEDEEDLMPTI
ncbi:MAG: hypothetical protein Q9216_006692, partial [Gyalolechia sp. 2 TL-2023]